MPQELTTGALNAGQFPADVTQPTQYGPGVKALAVYLQEYQHLPFERTQAYSRDMHHLPLSEGTLAQNRVICAERLEPVTEANVSPVAAVPAVRGVLTAAMRRVGLRGRVVMVGRDVGTAIVPEADSKIFLTASVETRAQRRYTEVSARGEDRSYGAILENLAERDRIDSSRQTAPLRAADDASQIDTTGLSLDAVVDLLARHVGATSA